ncbi:MAG TPA: DUF4136 domain-containing protein [Gemmatimonadaceae bacterium]|jgi:hypothetical protein|nr:DUF4136 domain-containing protein [Gemmatimonadaceae bacterium]
MKNRLFIATAAAFAFAAIACGSNIRVTVSVAPSANFAGYRRFAILTPPARADGRRLPDDPMLVNSITNRALSATVADAFISRGYMLDSTGADFEVAYYASSRERLDVTMWNYGYRGRWSEGYPAPGYMSAVPYAEGTVIVDVIDAKTRDLVWRGRGQATSSNDPVEFQKDLRGAVQSIVKQFPSAPIRFVPGP